MSFKVEHNYRFDAGGKLDADDWVLVPRARLRPGFTLDGAFADALAQRYFEIVKASSAVPLTIATDERGVRYVVPLNKTAMIFAEPERIVDATRAETSWRIAGGFMLAHGTNYGGRFYIGAEWEPSTSLKIYTTIRRYPPRLISWFGVPRGIAVYNRTQGPFHKQVQEKFLTETASRLTTSKN